MSIYFSINSLFKPCEFFYYALSRFSQKLYNPVDTNKQQQSNYVFRKVYIYISFVSYKNYWVYRNILALLHEFFSCNCPFSEG